MGSATKIMLADLAHTYSVSDRSLPIPLSIGYIKAYAVDALGDSVDARLFKHPERFLAAIEAERPDIVGFANNGFNQNLNLAVGRHVRQILPDALIVAGGPNIDTAEDRRLAFLKSHNYIDCLIVDGGEEPFAELVLWHRNGSRDTAQLPSNIVWRDGDRVHQTPERPLKKIIEHLPSPYINGYLDEFLAAGMIPLLETNRGCPFRCSFCAWGSASKDLVRRIDLNQALAEIAYVGERSDAANWIICDANFGILPRDIEIAKAIRKVKDARGCPNKCHVWLAKNVTARNLVIGEILNEMVQPVMAIQSLDDEVLKHIKVTFALIPPLEAEPDEKPIEIPSNLLTLDEATMQTFAPAADKKTIYLKETKARKHMRKTISSARGTTLSKILNTQGFPLRDLKLASADSYRFDQAFRRAV